MRSIARRTIVGFIRTELSRAISETRLVRVCVRNVPVTDGWAARRGSGEIMSYNYMRIAFFKPKKKNISFFRVNDNFARSTDT